MNRIDIDRYKLIWIGAMLLLSLGVSSCNRGMPTIPETEVVEIDPSDANALSSALIIDNAQEIDGIPPSPSDTPTAPRIEGNIEDLLSSNGSTFLLPFRYSAANQLAGAYFLIRGADGYFDIPITGLSPAVIGDNAEVPGVPAAPSIDSGNLILPIGLPQNLGLGEFEVLYGVYDDSGQTSNFIETRIGLVKVGTGALQVSLAWDSTPDIDLWITDPSGTEIYFGNKFSPTGGELDLDDRDGFGPENIYWTQDAPDGIYKIEVDYYRRSGIGGEPGGTGPTDYTVTINGLGANRVFIGSLNRHGDRDLVVEIEKRGNSLTFY